MSLQDNIFKYGVSGGMRYKEPEKLYFLNVFSKEFTDLGYEVKILKKDMKRYAGINCYIGDLVNAKNIIIAPYDTTLDSMDPHARYYPYSYRDSQKSLNEKNRYRAMVVIVIGVILMFLIPIILEPGALVVRISSLIISVAMTAIAYLQLKGRPNKVSANLNTSGLLAILEIAKEKPTDTAFVLTDREFVDNLGDLMLREALPTTLDQKNIIHLKAIGNGQHIVIAHSEDNLGFARKLANKDKSLDLFTLDKEGLVDNALNYYEKAVSISVCDKFNGRYEISDVSNENDVKIDEEKFTKVVEIVKNFIL